MNRILGPELPFLNQWIRPDESSPFPLSEVERNSSRSGMGNFTGRKKRFSHTGGQGWVMYERILKRSGQRRATSFSVHLQTADPNSWCPGQDLNLHDYKVTTPSRWRVYQFHHLGLETPPLQRAFCDLEKEDCGDGLFHCSSLSLFKNASRLGFFVIRLGLEPRTPTLKVSCSTN